MFGEMLPALGSRSLSFCEEDIARKLQGGYKILPSHYKDPRIQFTKNLGSSVIEFQGLRGR